MNNLISIFWAGVWFVVLILAIVGIFWTPALYFIIAIAVTLCALFINDYINVNNV